MSWTTRGIALILLLVGVGAGAAWAADYPPADHVGADFALANGDFIWGTHTGIGSFTIPAGATVRVMPYDGIATSTRGTLEIHAASVDIAGTIDATGAGYTGGGGAAGGMGLGGVLVGNVFYGNGAGGCCGGAADYGDPHWSGFYADFSAPPPGGIGGGPPGYPGHGDGLYGGGLTEELDGGYMTWGANGDQTDDDATTMGCGGGGGAGSCGWTESFPAYPPYHNGGATPYGGLGGGGGGRGGGTIRIFASSDFRLRAGAILDTGGVLGGNAFSSSGGSVSPPQQGLAGGSGATDGGRGAGGGILLQLATAQTAIIEEGSTIRALGGGSRGANGGTIKLRFNPGGGWTNSGTFASPRVCTASECWTSVADWTLF